MDTVSMTSSDRMLANIDGGNISEMTVGVSLNQKLKGKFHIVNNKILFVLIFSFLSRRGRKGSQIGRGIGYAP